MRKEFPEELQELMLQAADAIRELRDQRDQARRIACGYISGMYSKNNVPIDRIAAMAEADRRGWDCYKERGKCSNG
jgi:hypothetical protein